MIGDTLVYVRGYTWVTKNVQVLEDFVCGHKQYYAAHFHDLPYIFMSRYPFFHKVTKAKITE